MFVFIIPAICVGAQGFLLFSELKDHKETLFWYWTLADMVLNIIVMLTYKGSLKRVRQEQAENVTHFTALDRREQAIKKMDEVTMSEARQAAEEANEELEEEDGVQHGRMELSEDYYAVAFCTFIRYYQEKFQISAESRAIYVINVGFVFIMQLVLLGGIYYELTNEDSAEDGSITFTMMHFDVVLARLVCAVLMHLQSEPEVRQAMAMFKYVLNHSKVKTSAADLHKSMVDYVDDLRKKLEEKSEKNECTADEKALLETLNKEDFQWKHDSNPDEKTITDYFKQMKKFQVEVAFIPCKHPIQPELYYLLTRGGKKNKDITPDQVKNPETIDDKKWMWKGSERVEDDCDTHEREDNLRDYFQNHRMCKQMHFSRDELAEINARLGIDFKTKKTDQLFYKANLDGDIYMEEFEWVRIYQQELELKGMKQRIIQTYRDSLLNKGQAATFYFGKLLSCFKCLFCVSCCKKKGQEK